MADPQDKMNSWPIPVCVTVQVSMTSFPGQTGPLNG